MDCIFSHKDEYILRRMPFIKKIMSMKIATNFGRGKV